MTGLVLQQVRDIQSAIDQDNDLGKLFKKMKPDIQGMTTLSWFVALSLDSLWQLNSISVVATVQKINCSINSNSNSNSSSSSSSSSSSNSSSSFSNSISNSNSNILIYKGEDDINKYPSVHCDKMSHSSTHRVIDKYNCKFIGGSGSGTIFTMI